MKNYNIIFSPTSSPHCGLPAKMSIVWGVKHLQTKKCYPMSNYIIFIAGVARGDHLDAYLIGGRRTDEKRSLYG